MVTGRLQTVMEVHWSQHVTSTRTWVNRSEEDVDSLQGREEIMSLSQSSYFGHLVMDSDRDDGKNWLCRQLYIGHRSSNWGATKSIAGQGSMESHHSSRTPLNISKWASIYIYILDDDVATCPTSVPIWLRMPFGSTGCCMVDVTIWHHNGTPIMTSPVSIILYPRECTVPSRSRYDWLV